MPGGAPGIAPVARFAAVKRALATVLACTAVRAGDRRGRADPRGRPDRGPGRVRGLARDAQPGRRAAAAAPPVHGAERAIEPARRRVPDRHERADRPARARHERRVDLLLGRLRVGDVRLARADRHRLRGAERADAQTARPEHARRARLVRAAAAPAGRAGAATCSRTSRAAATSTSTTRTGRSSRRRRATCWSSRSGENGFAQERDYDLTSAVPSGDKIISALPDWSGLDLVRVDRRASSARVDLANGRRSSRYDTGERERQLVRGRRRGRGLHRHRRRALPLPGGPRRHAGDRLARRLREHRDAEARPGAEGLGHDADGDGRRRWWRSPTTPTR